MLPEYQSRILSRVKEMRDIKISQLLFKEGQLDTDRTIIVNVNMQSALAIDHYRMLINTSMMARKSL